MEKEEWVKRAEEKLRPYMGEQSREYAESLYQTYEMEDGDWEPEDAVDEDMSYWGG